MIHSSETSVNTISTWRHIPEDCFLQENSSLQASDTFFWGKRKCNWQGEIRAASNKQNWRKNCKISSNCTLKSSADCQEHNRASELKILTWGRCVQTWSQRSSPENTVMELLASKQITMLKHFPYSPDPAPSDFFCSWRWRKYERKTFWWHWWRQE
jgi:hypothetical protein